MYPNANSKTTTRRVTVTAIAVLVEFVPPADSVGEGRLLTEIVPPADSVGEGKLLTYT